MAYHRIPSGSSMVLNTLLYDGSSTKYPLAYVYNTTDYTQVTGSPFALTHKAFGLYTNEILLNDGRYHAVYVIYDDAAHTQINQRYARSSDVFDVNDIINVNAISEGVWRETFADNAPVGSFGKVLTDTLAAAGSSVTADAKLDEILNNRLTLARALNLDNMDVVISSRATPSQAADAVWDEAVADHNTAGSFGLNLDAQITSRQSETSADARFTSIQSGQSTITSNLSTALSDLGAVKVKTDQMAFVSGNLKAQAEVVVDKTDFELSAAGRAVVVNDVWSKDISTYSSGEAGFALNSSPDQFWNALRADHNVPGSFGEANQGVVSNVRATNLDNLDVTVGSRQSTSTAGTQYNDLVGGQGVISGILSSVDSKIGSPVSSLSSDLVQILGHTSLLGAPTGASLSSDIAAIKAVSDANSSAISTVNTKIGSPASSLSVDIAGVSSLASAVKTKTDLMTFSAGKIVSQADVVLDKTGYSFSGTQLNSIKDSIWNAPATAYTTAGSMAVVVKDTASGLSPSAIADAVLDETISEHSIAGSLGNTLQVYSVDLNAIKNAQNNATYGFGALRNLIEVRSATLEGEINANEGKIDSVISQMAADKVQVIGEINTNETKIDALTPALTSLQANVLAEIDANEVKIDALDGKVGALQNNTTVRFIVPDRMTRPSTGAKNYRVFLRLYDENGNPEAPDTAPILDIIRQDTGANLVSTAMLPDGTKVGAFYYDHSVASSAALTPMVFEATVVENGVTRYIPMVSEVVEFDTSMAAIQTSVNQVNTKVDGITTHVTDPSYGLSALRTGQAAIEGKVDTANTSLGSISSDVALLPTDVADSADVSALTAQIAAKPSNTDIQTKLDNAVTSLKGSSNRDLSQVYTRWDDTNLLKTNDARLVNLDAPVSSRSSHTPAQVWSYSSRGLTSYQTLTEPEISSIWSYALSQITTPGSVGERVKSNLDVTVSSRAQATDVSSALAGVAQESTLNSTGSAIDGDLTAIINALGSVTATLATIAGKTNNLPADPASQSALSSAISSLNTILSDVQSKTNSVKTKTDNLPTDPAREATVAAIPTNPSLATDLRFNNLTNLDAPVSSLTPPDISGLATSAELSSVSSSLNTKVDAVQAKADTIDSKADLIKGNTDNIPANGATQGDVSAAKTDVLSAISSAEASLPGATSSAVWSETTRGLTEVVDTGLNLAGLAEKTDLTPLGKVIYENRMSTTFNGQTGEQQIIAWAEKEGQAVSGTDCTVSIRQSDGTEVWTSTLANPNADGIFRFQNTFSSTSAQNFYVVITIRVDGTLRTSYRTFFTV